MSGSGLSGSGLSGSGLSGSGSSGSGSSGSGLSGSSGSGSPYSSIILCVTVLDVCGFFNCPESNDTVFEISLSLFIYVFIVVSIINVTVCLASIIIEVLIVCPEKVISLLCPLISRYTWFITAFSGTSSEILTNASLSPVFVICVV